MTDCDPYVFTSTLIRSCIDYAVVGDCNHPLSSRSAEQRSVPMNGAASHKKKKERLKSFWLRRFQMRIKDAGQRISHEPFKDSAQHSLVPVPKFILAFLEVEDLVFH